MRIRPQTLTPTHHNLHTSTRPAFIHLCIEADTYPYIFVPTQLHINISSRLHIHNCAHWLMICFCVNATLQSQVPSTPPCSHMAKRPCFPTFIHPSFHTTLRAPTSIKRCVHASPIPKSRHPCIHRSTYSSRTPCILACSRRYIDTSLHTHDLEFIHPHVHVMRFRVFMHSDMHASTDPYVHASI